MRFQTHPMTDQGALRGLVLAALLVCATFGCARETPVCPPCGDPGATQPPSTTKGTSAPLPAPATPAFDPGQAWAEYDKTLRGTYAYLTRDDFDVEAWLKRVEAAALKTRDRAAFRGLLQRAGYAFTDPHFMVGPLTDGDLNVWPTSGDLRVAVKAERIVVEDVRAESAADRAGVRPGWQLLTIGGRPVDALVAALHAELLPKPTPKQRAYAATLLVNGRRKGKRALRFQRPSGAVDLTLPNPREFARSVRKRPRVVALRHGDVVRLRLHNSLGDNDTIAAFDAALKPHLEAKGLILDLRGTPSGGNTDVARAIIGHFVREARPYQMHEIPAIERRCGVPRRFVEYVLPRAPHFPGRVAVLAGAWTGSMGEGVVIGMAAAAKARTFASDMGDLLGALHSFPLKACAGRLHVGAESLFHVDGTPRGDYVAAVPLPRADRGVDGGDPGLEAALAWLRTP